MSSYTSIYGHIEYTDKASLNKALKLLVKDGWLNKDHEWLDDGGDSIDNGTTVNNLTLAMPNTCIRNFSRVLDDFLKGVASCKVVWTCTDGDFSGGIITATKPTGLKKDLNIESKVIEKSYDLTDWAKKNKLPIVKYSEKNEEEYYEWIRDIEDAFIDKYL